MCGIAGILTRQPGAVVDAEMLRRLSRTLAHRGPDDEGFLAFDGTTVRTSRDPAAVAGCVRVAFVHRRLAIVDLSDGGWQPMASHDGCMHIVFNGEVYNHVELRRELEAKGHQFRSTSDTEVLLAAFREWGAAAVARFVGMFALVVLDLERRELLLARDPFGIKPLYYAVDGEHLMFASEAKALRDVPWISRRIHPLALYEYLRYGMTDYGARTMIEGVRRVPLAHTLRIPLDGPWTAEPEPYWSSRKVATRACSFGDAVDAVREGFRDSIRLHLRSDVPIGFALSGGVDSSAILAAVRAEAGPSADLHAFSYIAGDGAVSEEAWVDLVGHATGAQLHKVRLTTTDLQHDIDHLIAAHDFPFGSTSIYAQYRVFRLAHEHGIKVMLDGQGADEVLGGYRTNVAARLASLLRQGRFGRAATLVASVARLPGENHLQPSAQASLRLMATAGAFVLPESLKGIFARTAGRSPAPPWMNSDWFRERGVEPRVLQFRADGDEVLHDTMHRMLERDSLPYLLRYEDRNSMVWSVESRVPFLTTAFAELAISLPEEYLIDDHGTTKAVFRAAMRGIVPDAVLDRRDKIGFSTPERAWLDAFTPWVDDLLSDRSLREIPLLRPEALRRAWARQRGHSQPIDRQVWRWCNLIAWARLHGIEFA